MEFKDREEAMSDPEVTAVECYKCGRPLKKELPWFVSRSKVYYSLCRCPEHGYLRGKIRLRETDHGKTYAVKTLRLTDEEGARQIHALKDSIIEKRKERRHNMS